MRREAISVARLDGMIWLVEEMDVIAEGHRSMRDYFDEGGVLI